MRILHGLLLMFLLAGGLMAGWEASAQSPAASSVAQLTDVDRLVLAERIARYAREAGDPEAMIVASRMLADTQINMGDFGGVVSGARQSFQTPVTAAVPTAEAYLTEARLLAAGRPASMALVAAEAESQRRITRQSGVSGGALAMPKVLHGGTTWSFDLLVEAGKPATLAAVGDGDSDVNVRVLNVAGALVASDTAPDYQAVVRWVPASASRFRIEIENAGPVTTYIMVYSN